MRMNALHIHVTEDSGPIKHFVCFTDSSQPIPSLDVAVFVPRMYVITHTIYSTQVTNTVHFLLDQNITGSSWNQIPLGHMIRHQT